MTINKNRQKQKQDKKQKQNKKLQNREKKRIIKNEIDILNQINELPSELVDYIYLFMNNKIKYNLSYYFQLYKKNIINYNFKNRCIYKDFNRFDYYTFDKTSKPLQSMLQEIPIDILEKYINRGTPEIYFTIAFPEEGNINDYLLLNYKIDKSVEEKYKDYIFEVIDLLSYFVTRTNQFSLYKNYESVEYYKFKECELVSKKIILSIIYLYHKYVTIESLASE